MWVYLCMLADSSRAQICLLGLGCLVVSWFEHFRKPQWRPYRALMFVGLGLSSVVPVVHALRLYGFRHMDERMGLRWVFLQGALYIIGAFIYAVRSLPFPSAVSPGITPRGEREKAGEERML